MLLPWLTHHKSVTTFENMYFQYGFEEMDYLSSRDEKLGWAIACIGPIEREAETDLFASVVRHIIGQQISTAAQATVWSRLISRVGAVTARTLLALGREELQRIGTSFRKVDYIVDFARKVQEGAFDVEALWDMPDERVIKELTALKGIGLWTAEMIMIFCMRRSDVLSFGDLAILRGMRMLYGYPKIDRLMFETFRKRYSPHGSVASLYLWTIAGGALPDLTDSALKGSKQ